MQQDYENITRKMIKNKRSIKYIAGWFDINVEEMRNIILKHEIEPASTDRELVYYRYAKKIKDNVEKAYFFTDLSEIVDIPLFMVKKICNMYNLRPCKKAYCVVCGKEIDMSKYSVEPKYCSRKCSDKNNRPDKQPKEKQPIKKTCVYCETVFDGKSNSKYCSDDCKKLYKNKEEVIKWLKG